MILYAASILIFLFVSIALFWRARCPVALKAAGTLLLLFISFKYEIYRYLGGYFFSPNLPRPFLLLMEALYGALIILFFLLLLFELYILGNWLMARAGFPAPRHLPLGLIKCGLTALALAIGIWGTWQAVKAPAPRIIELKIANLPKGLEGLKLAQLTDLHIGPILKKDWLTEVVARTNALEPDLILLTGDYVDGFVAEIGHELEPLADLHSRYGVWAVTGNHEYYWNMPQWREALDNLNVKMLENSHKAIPINGDNIIIAGIADLAAKRFGMEGPDLDKALAGAPAGLRVLLSHQPKYGRDFVEKIDLMLSGHTHGGHMFFLQPLIARFNAGFVKGLYPVEGKNIYVSPGTGLWNGFSSRIGAPSEISLFILKNEGSKTN